MRGITLINLVLVVISIIVIVIICFFIKDYIFTTPQANLFKILKEIEDDKNFYPKNYSEETLNAGDHTIKFYKPYNTKTIKEISDGERVYSINNSEINYSFLNKYDRNLSGVLDGTAQIYNSNNFYDFEISNRVIKYTIGENVFYKTTLTTDGKIVLDATLPKGYGLTIQVINGKNITKEQLQGFLNFKLY
ncbi:MAG: hypothetical protein IKG14_01115 [Clostridia bacterium]|nr:hypothetical protein [Clostridia bacterium]